MKQLMVKANKWAIVSVQRWHDEIVDLQQIAGQKAATQDHKPFSRGNFGDGILCDRLTTGPSGELGSFRQQMAAISSIISVRPFEFRYSMTVSLRNRIVLTKLDCKMFYKWYGWFFTFEVQLLFYKGQNFDKWGLSSYNYVWFYICLDLYRQNKKCLEICQTQWYTKWLVYDCLLAILSLSWVHYSADQEIIHPMDV